jgi:pimeloyl-ACP methyl ester carboxylesterase
MAIGHGRAVQELAGEFTATYSYDRAGHGSNDPGDPWSLEGLLADLEAWLRAGPVSPPYLLVGHSLGGHVVRTFAARHLADVMGMVLLDARHEDLYRELPQPFLVRLAELVPDGAERANRADASIRALPALGDLPLSVISLMAGPTGSPRRSDSIKASSTRPNWPGSTISPG